MKPKAFAVLCGCLLAFWVGFNVEAVRAAPSIAETKNVGGLKRTYDRELGVACYEQRSSGMQISAPSSVSVSCVKVQP